MGHAVLHRIANALLLSASALVGCASPRHAAPKPLGPPVGASPLAPFVGFHASTMTSSLSVNVTDDLRVASTEEMTALLRTKSGRISFVTFEEAERGGRIVHAMQALTLSPEILDVDVERGVLCTLTIGGVMTCGDLHAQSVARVNVVPTGKRLLLVNREKRCVLDDAGVWSCYRASGSTWAADPTLTRELSHFGETAEPIASSRCFITRSAKLVCLDVDGTSASLVAEDVVDASLGRGAGIAAGGCAVLRGGAVTCWGGINDTGVLGDGKRGPHEDGAIVRGVRDAIAVSRSPDFACALTRGGHVWCWGSADAWSFGDAALSRAKDWPVCRDDQAPGKHECVTRARFGMQRNHLVLEPVVVPELEGVISIATSPTRTCGVRTDGRLLCVGGGHAGPYTVDLGPP